VEDRGGGPFIVMEYAGGGSLRDRVERDGRVQPAEALGWLEQAPRAIDNAHARGVVHRDVKPANLLLDEDGNVHVADFGVASVLGLEPLTLTGTILGTAGYLSPEQARGEQATSASDRYALAVVAFELLTGSRPFASDVPTVEAAAHIHSPVPSACGRAPDLPCELDPVFERALAKEPGRRYSSCAGFVGDLRAALAAAEAPARRIVAQPPPRRRRPLVPLFALALLVAGGVVAALLSTGERGNRAAPPPRTQVVTVTGSATTDADPSAPSSCRAACAERPRLRADEARRLTSTSRCSSSVAAATRSARWGTPSDSSPIAGR
jgi:hypothetical protein